MKYKTLTALLVFMFIPVVYAQSFPPLTAYHTFRVTLVNHSSDFFYITGQSVMHGTAQSNVAGKTLFPNQSVTMIFDHPLSPSQRATTLIANLALDVIVRVPPFFQPSHHQYQISLVNPSRINKLHVSGFILNRTPNVPSQVVKLKQSQLQRSTTANPFDWQADSVTYTIPSYLN